MAKTKIKRRLRATLRGLWWTNFFKSIRFCYQCGESLVRRHVQAEGRKRHVCVKCSNITYLNPKVVAGVIPVTSDGKILLLKRNLQPGLGKWSYPAGYQEIGESVDQAAVRETQEETGLTMKLTKLVGIFSYPDAGVVTIVYEALVPKSRRPTIDAESQDWGFYSWSEIPWSELAFRSTVDALREWKQK